MIVVEEEAVKLGHELEMGSVMGDAAGVHMQLSSGGRGVFSASPRVDGAGFFCGDPCSVPEQQAAPGRERQASNRRLPIFCSLELIS